MLTLLECYSHSYELQIKLLQPNYWKNLHVEDFREQISPSEKFWDDVELSDQENKNSSDKKADFWKNIQDFVSQEKQKNPYAFVPKDKSYDVQKTPYSRRLIKRYLIIKQNMRESMICKNKIEYEDVVELFWIYDHDKDGRVYPDDLICTIFYMEKRQASYREIYSMFDKLDLDKKGFLELQDFIKIIDSQDFI